MCKVSVLVAVYNAEATLPQCLDSLLSQTLNDIQIICIDDGSTDGSLHILNTYALKDMRVEVIRLLENSGQAHARNVGLQRAEGDIVCMVDADDWLSVDALEQMAAAFDDETDSVLFDVVYKYADHEEPYPMTNFNALTGEEAFRLSLTWKIHGLYGIRRTIHQQHPYDETCRTYSDDNTTRVHYLLSRKIRKCQGIYYYRQHSDSVTHQISVRRFDYLRANESMRCQMLQLHVAKELIDEYENHRWLNLVGIYMFYHVHGRQLTKAEREHGLRELHHAWTAIDRRALQKVTTAKFGYHPCNSWTLFRLQEWLYFTLRGMMGKNY